MLGMHQQAHEIIAVGRQAVKYADAHVVTATQLGAVHSLGVIAVVAFGSRRVQRLVVLTVISLLEQDVGAYAGGLEFLIGLNLGSGNIDVQAADFSITHLGVIDGVD